MIQNDERLRKLFLLREVACATNYYLADMLCPSMNDNLKWLVTIRYLKEDIVHDTCEEGKARLEKAILLVESVGLDLRNIDLALESVKCVSHFPPLNATAKSMYPSEVDILAFARESVRITWMKL